MKNDLEFQYITSGSGEAFMLLGGGLSDSASSFEIVMRYEKRYHVISPSYPVTTSSAAVADGLAAILDAEGAETANVYGHSLGGALAHLFVRRYPERVDKLIISDFGLYTWGHRVLAKMFLRLPPRLLALYYNSSATRSTAAITDESEREFVREYFRDLSAKKFNDKTAIAQLRLLTDFFDNEVPYSVYKPISTLGGTLIIAANDDPGFSWNERGRLISTYPGARVCLFKTGGHWLSLNRPVEYFQNIDGFLRE